jgi:small conductance mechanosensitive channel
VETGDYFETYWAITRAVKMRFDEEGISIPFPQTDVHLYKT